MTAGDEAMYQALLFDPASRTRLIVISVAADIAAASAFFLLDAPIVAIVALALAPAIIMMLLVERGVWRVDSYGIQATLKPIVPFLPERRESASWTGMDSYQIRVGKWVPRYLKIMRGNRALMTVYEPAEDDAKAAAFAAFTAAFERMAAARKIRRD